MELAWRSAMLRLARSDLARKLSSGTGLGRRVARRFVAGETVDDAIRVARDLNRRGLGAELDYLGENVTAPEQADEARITYLALLRRLSACSGDSHISMKLTGLGLDLDRSTCVANLTAIMEVARSSGVFVWLDMESSEYVDPTLEIYRETRSRYDNIGVAIQSYLYRSERDVRSVLSIGGSMRLCKGAYMEPPEVAYPRKSDVDRSFASLAGLLLSSGHYQAFATHDDRLMKYVLRYARSKAIAEHLFEFHLLYGVRRDLQLRLVREGHRTRVYVPFGGQWFPYLMRRLAERPANLLFLARSFAGEAASRERSAAA